MIWLVVAWILLWAVAVWKMQGYALVYQQRRRIRRDTKMQRGDLNRTPHMLDAPTEVERFDKAFIEAWIEPAQRIIDRIDAECTPPEPEPVEAQGITLDPEMYHLTMTALRERQLLIARNALLEERLKQMTELAQARAVNNASPRKWMYQ